MHLLRPPLRPPLSHRYAHRCANRVSIEGPFCVQVILLVRQMLEQLGMPQGELSTSLGAVSMPAKSCRHCYAQCTLVCMKV